MQSEQHQDDGYGHLIPGGLTRKSVSVAKLPIIDFEPFLEGSASGKREVAQGLRNACVDVGFFYLANHGVPQPIIDRAFAQAKPREHNQFKIELGKRTLIRALRQAASLEI